MPWPRRCNRPHPSRRTARPRGRVSPRPTATLPGLAKRPPVLPGSKLPFYIGLGVAGGIMLIVLIVAAISFSGNNSRPVVKPTPVFDPQPVKPKKHEHTPGEMFPNVEPTN